MPLSKIGSIRGGGENIETLTILDFGLWISLFVLRSSSLTPP